MKKTLVIAALFTTLLSAPAFAQNGLSANSIMGMATNMAGSKSSGSTNAASSMLGSGAMKGLGGASMLVIDTNHDGMISKSEMNAFNERIFDIADTNHDGKLSSSEMATFTSLTKKALSMAH
jgi:hypothetical protein